MSGSKTAAVRTTTVPAKLALVVGVSQYGLASRDLPNAVNDASDVANRLKDEAGFHVDLCVNPSRCV